MKTFGKSAALWSFLILALVALGPVLFAEDGSKDTGNLFEKIMGIKAGAFGIIVQSVILLVSIFMIGWAIECFVNVQRDKIVPPEVVAHLQGYIDEGDLEGAVQYCEAAPNTLTRIMHGPLIRMQNGWDAMVGAADQQISVESGKLNYHISPLALVSALGPMFGLFGTVSGMVGAFDKMAAEGPNMSPSAVAGSIGLALMSTVMGLVIAIPGMIFFWLFQNRTIRIMDDITLIVDDMLDQLRGYIDQAKA
ncbi:MAG: MotA/TolQ/ExbB proton channel family protein [Planctomycetes bacterium]|nr:MotA/TolQ/ExbB proton channel family protein [Planctomycetota bacterium]